MEKAKIDAVKNLLAAMNVPAERAARIVASCKDEQGATAGKVKLLTTRQAAEQIECHPKVVARYAKRHGIEPVRRSARCIRWRESDIEKIRLGDFQRNDQTRPV